MVEVSRLMLWLIMAVALPCFGCDSSDDIERVVVFGSVAYDGEPIAKGAIRFIPVHQTKGPSAGSEIIDGAYRVDKRGGVGVGTFRVEIDAFRDTKPAGENIQSLDDFGSESATTAQYLPAKHNSKSQLEVTIKSGSDTVERDFDLEE